MVYLLFAIMLILFLVCLYIFNIEIMSPSVISTGMFTLSTGFAVLNAKEWSIEYSPLAFTFLTTGVLVIIFVELLTKKLFSHKVPSAVKMERENCLRHVDRNLSLLIMICCTLALLLYIRSAVRLANGPASIFKGSIFYRINQFSKKSIQLKLEGGIGTLYVQLGKLIKVFAYIYLFKLVNNIVYGEKIKKNLDSVYMVALYILLIMFQGTRTPLIDLFVFVFFLFYVKCLQRKNWMFKKKVGAKFFKMGLVIVFIGMPLFFFFGEYVLGRHTGNTIWQYISAYIGGSIKHFSQYIVEPIEPNAHFAEESFVYVYQGLYKLGLSDYTRTAYLEYRWLSPLIHGNVYTFFRRPLQDFGIVGMYIYTVFVFGIYSYLYYVKVRNRCSSYKSDRALFFVSYIYPAVIYVSIESSGFANIISIGNIALYIVMLICFRIVFRVKLKIK